MLTGCRGVRIRQAGVLTLTVSLQVFDTCDGLNAFARKKSTSNVPGFRGVKKNSRVECPPEGGSKFASRRPTRLAVVGSIAQMYPARSVSRTERPWFINTSTLTG